MANWTILKAAIANVIKTNGNQEITGAVLQNTLNSIVNAVGENATFAGVATPSTNPGVPDGPVFYLATRAGIYSNFGGVKLEKNASIFLNKDNNWQIIDIDIPISLYINTFSKNPIWELNGHPFIIDLYLPYKDYVSKKIGMTTIFKDDDNQNYRFNLYTVNENGNYTNPVPIGQFLIPYSEAKDVVISSSISGYAVIDFNIAEKNLKAGANHFRNIISESAKIEHYGVIRTYLNTKAISDNTKAISDNTKAISDNAKAISDNTKAIYHGEVILPDIIYLTQDAYDIKKSMPHKLYIDHIINAVEYVDVDFDLTKRDCYHLCSSLVTKQQQPVDIKNYNIKVNGIEKITDFNLSCIVTKSDTGIDKPVRLLFIGDSVGVGYGGAYNRVNNNPDTLWAIAQKLFLIDKIKSGKEDAFNMQCIGFYNTVHFTATYNGISKISTAYGEGRGGWSLKNYLYEDIKNNTTLNPFFDADKTWVNESLNEAGVKFSLKKYLERFRNYTDSGIKINEGEEGIGTNIYFSGSSSVNNLMVRDNSAYVNTPTHVVIQLGFNDSRDDSFIENMRLAILAIKEEFPDIIIGISMIDCAGGCFPNLYPDYANSSILRMINNELHRKIFNWISGIKQICSANGAYFIPCYFIQPTFKGIGVEKAESADGEISYFYGEPGYYHPNNVAHSAWGQQLYSWIKYTLQ